MIEVKIERRPFCGGEECIESNVSSVVGGVCVINGTAAEPFFPKRYVLIAAA